MKLVVQNFLKSAKLHVLDTETGAIIDADTSEARPKAKGYFAKLGETPVVLYAQDGRLHLRAGDEALALTGMKVELSGDGLRAFRVIEDDRVVLRLSYPNPVNPPMEFDLTMAEEEDFDLGMFIRNVLASGERRRRMLDKWSAA